ncbi:MAG: hypothetical protein Q8Q39_00015 [bacterium]|nr:hypothetical protein [bacterium]
METEARLQGYIAEVPMFDRETHRPLVIDGEVQYRQVVRTMNGRDYGFNWRDIESPGLSDVEVGQRVEFMPGTYRNRPQALHVRRLVTETRRNRRHARIGEEIATQNGHGDHLEAVVEKFFNQFGYGFAKLLVNGGSVHLRRSRIVTADHDDVTGLRKGQRIRVKLGEAPRNEHHAPSAETIFVPEV